MSRSIARRALAGLAGLAVVLLAPVPARAAAPVEVDLRVEDVHVTPGNSQDVQLTLYSRTAVSWNEPGGVQLSLSGGLTGVVLSGNLRMFPCEDTVGPALSCSLQVFDIPAGGAGKPLGYSGAVHAEKDAVLGTTGTLTVTVSAPNIKTVRSTAKVIVGTAPSASASPSSPASPSASVSPSASASPSVSASASASAGPSASVSPSASVTSSPAAGGGADDGGEGGGLPVTGPQGATLAGAGIALVLAGVAGFLLTRRRRARFEA